MVAVMKNKQLSMKKGSKVANEGPSGKMMKRQFTGTQKPGVSSQEQSKSGGTGAKGGTTKMFGKSGSKKQTPA